MNIQIFGKVSGLGNILTDTSSDDLVTILLFHTLLHFLCLTSYILEK